MANIALDIKANTQKALGEFRKLSRELDNKFLVQGLKLDVVKNAFRQINREFEQSLGQQGFNTAESTNQIQRNAAANLAVLNKLSIDAAANLTKNVTKNLQGLQAQGEITGEAIRETLSAASFFDFRGSQQEVEASFNAFSQRFAKFATDTNDIFGKSQAGSLQRVLTGQSRVEELFDLDFGLGGAGSNVIAKYLREQGIGVENISAEARTQIVERFLRDIEDTSTEIGKTFSVLERQAQIDDPFRFLRREIGSLFSPRGVFGALTAYGTTIREINGERVPVDRNILNTTANLLKAFFDKDDGLFATLFSALGEAFGFDPKKPLEPIIRGIELFTDVIESITDFFAGPTFQSILNVFKPLVEAVKNIFSGGELDFSVDSINNIISSIFEGIRGFLSKVIDSIKSIDGEKVGSILGNIATEIGKSIPSVISLIFEGIKKVVGTTLNTISSAEGPLVKAVLGGGALTAAGLLLNKLISPIVNFFTRREGGLLGSGVRRIDQIVRTSLFNAQKAPDGGARGFGREFFRNIRRGGGTTPYETGNPDLARSGGFSGWQGEVIRKFNQIIIILRDAVPVYPARPNYQRGGGSRPPAGGPRGRVTGSNIGGTDYPDQPLGPMTREEFIRSRAEERNQRAASLRRQRQRRDFSRRFGTRVGRFGSGIRGGLSRVGSIGRSFGGRFAGLGISALSMAAGGDFYGGMADDYMDAGTQYMSPIGPLPLNSVDPYAENLATGGFDPRLDSAGFAPRQTALQRLERRRAYRRSLRGRVGGIGRGIGRLGRGLGRLGGPLVGAALTAFSLSTLFGGDANAEETEGMTAEDRRQMRRDRNRSVLGGIAGIAGGAAGGALLGTSLGPVGTVIGGILGGIVGEEAVKMLSDPIIDGIGDLADRMGGFFKGLWSKVTGGAGQLGNFIKGGWENIVNFFGEDGPIQSTARWFTDLPGKIGNTLKEAWGRITQAIMDTPTWLLTALLGPLGLAGGALRDILSGNQSGAADKLGVDDPEKKSLGGRVMFNEKGTGEIGILPMGTTFITPSSMPQVLSAMGGRSQAGEINNNIVVNVYSDGGSTNEVADAVIARIDEVYRSLSNSQGLRSA